MKKIEKDKRQILKVLFIIYLMVFPIFDIVYLYNHITTLLRVIVLLLYVVATLVLYKDSRKSFKYLIAYYLAMIGFLIIDYFHSRGFTSLVPGDFNYSVVSEAMTLIKLCMPFTMIFIMKYQKLSKEEIFRVVNVWAIIIAGSIVLCNICGYSLSSYTDTITRYSIFSWGQGLEMKYIATKGFFMYANQEAILLLMLLVLTIYQTFFVNKKAIVLVFLISLASIMLGTRISTIAALMALIVVLILYVLYTIIYKKKCSKMIVGVAAISLGWVLIYPISPNSVRLKELDNNIVPINQESDVEPFETEDIEVINSELEDKMNEVDSKINKSIFGERFYKEVYPYNYDIDFWVELVNNPNTPTNYRDMEVAIIKRIIEVDDRKSDVWFGISNSRIQNIVNIERDFLVQYYAFGIVGLIITSLFYIYALFICCKSVLKEKKFFNLMILACLCLFMLASFFSGNSLNFLATIVPLSFIVGLLYHNKDLV